MYLDWNPDNQYDGDIQVDFNRDFSSVLLRYNGLTARLDGHQAFVLMKGLAELLNYDLIGYELEEKGNA